MSVRVRVSLRALIFRNSFFAVSDFFFEENVLTSPNLVTFVISVPLKWDELNN